jgi:hypothetical protein
VCVCHRERSSPTSGTLIGTVVYTGRATDEDHVGLMSVYPRSDQRILGVALSMVTSILEEYVASIYKVE